ncbi:DUF6551 family protein [Henriciella sp.]|uniref:DUF6551 family protein n=1 Tax=Henriciella sp. TaxID=1968823 RepID=UPI00261DAD37|nr:DUF6551 family protein [Henriciella sp.]
MSDSLKLISELATGLNSGDPSEDIGTPGRVDRVSVLDLIIDTRYQRTIEAAGARNIRRIVEGFRWEKFEPLIVAPSPDWPGKYAVIDGQHRALAAWLHPDINTVPAVVHELNPREQARAFRDVNKNRTKIGPLHIYRAGLISGDPSAIGIQAVTNAASVEVARFNLSKANMQPHQLVCVNAVGKALKRSGFEAVSRALLCLRRAAKGCDCSLMSAWAVQVVSICLASHRSISNDAMVDVLQSVDLDTEVKDRADELAESYAKKMATGADVLARMVQSAGAIAA